MSLTTVSQSFPANRGLPLTQRQETEIIAYFEQKYWETGALPTAEKVAADTGFPSNRIAKFAGTDRFKSAMKSLGLKQESLADGVLTPEQIVVANMYLNTWDTSSMRQKLEILGITTQQFSAWKRDPAFSNYLQKRAEEQFKASDAAAFKTLVTAMEQGDLQAAKLYFEMRGRYQPKVQVNVNIESLMYRMVEIVAKHIDDQDVLEVIANELEELTSAP